MLAKSGSRQPGSQRQQQVRFRRALKAGYRVKEAGRVLGA